MLLIPSIELKNHKCRFKIEGNIDIDDYYLSLTEHPYELCKLFRQENVKSIHIYDNDSFINHEDNNYDLIAEMTQATFLPFQVNCNFQNYSDCSSVLEYGVHRLVISDFAINHQDLVSRLINDYTTQRIAFLVPIYKNQVYFNHINKAFSIDYYLKHIKELGASRVIIKPKDFEIDGLVNNKKLLTTLQSDFSAWTLDYDVAGYKELRLIEDLKLNNLDSLIIGKPFYSSVFPCQEIWRMAEKEIIINEKN